MAIITPATTFKFGPECGMGQARYDLASLSDSTGADQARLLGPPRWTFKLVQPAFLTLKEAGEWQTLLMQLRGRVNVLACWDPVRLAPQGTLRGSPLVNGAQSAGITSVSLKSAGVGSTLLRGDKLQFGTGLGSSQVVMVTADATSDGAGLMTVAIEPPLRVALFNNAAVVWDKPLVYYRQQGSNFAYTYGNRGLTATGFAGDFLEAFG